MRLTGLGDFGGIGEASFFFNLLLEIFAVTSTGDLDGDGSTADSASEEGVSIGAALFLRLGGALAGEASVEITRPGLFFLVGSAGSGDGDATVAVKETGAAVTSIDEGSAKGASTKENGAGVIASPNDGSSVDSVDEGSAKGASCEEDGAGVLALPTEVSSIAVLYPIHHQN